MEVSQWNERSCAKVGARPLVNDHGFRADASDTVRAAGPCSRSSGCGGPGSPQKWLFPGLEEQNRLRLCRVFGIRARTVQGLIASLPLGRSNKLPKWNYTIPPGLWS